MMEFSLILRTMGVGIRRIADMMEFANQLKQVELAWDVPLEEGSEFGGDKQEGGSGGGLVGAPGVGDVESET